MLSYQKDGKKVECHPIYSSGRVGQVVILYNVSFGEKPNLEKYPLSVYPRPYTFTIVEVVEGKDGYYLVEDSEGRHTKVHDEFSGASCYYLFDANELLTWREGYEADKLARKQRKIELLESHLALLKSILTNQGIRVVSSETAKELGLA